MVRERSVFPSAGALEPLAGYIRFGRRHSFAGRQGIVAEDNLLVGGMEVGEGVEGEEAIVRAGMVRTDHTELPWYEFGFVVAACLVVV